MTRAADIEDRNVVAGCVAIEDAGALELTFELRDERDPSLRARCVFQVEPQEALALIDQMLIGLRRLGVKLSIHDDESPGEPARGEP